jgi:hypothetical protein
VTAQIINGHRINNYRWQSTQVDGVIDRGYPAFSIGNRNNHCPFAHFYMPDLIKQNLYFAMVSAFKGKIHIFISFIFYSTKKLLEHNLNFAKT